MDNDPLQFREKIIEYIGEYFEAKSYIFAYWLGGSDANDESDEYSDLDIFLCVKDGQEEDVLSEMKRVLSSFGSLDYIENIEYKVRKISQNFHIENTPESLIIEVYLVPQSEGMQFIYDHPAFKPKILFDKDNVITFHELDTVDLHRKILTQLAEQKNLMMESGRAIKYIQRQEYIEATNYYIKYVFLPLVSVLRIRYTPLLYDWLRIHISRHFPKDVVERLNNLMCFTSSEDILQRIPLAREWFWETMKELEKPGAIK